MSIDLLKKFIQTGNVVFFGGAGVSTESGIPDFRSTDGLYNQKYEYPPEEILSHSFFIRNTKEFYRFYREKILYLNAKPNKAHITLAALEEQGFLKAVVTQNIDGLHQAAGSKKVLELHGSIHRNFCTYCNKPYEINVIAEGNGVPYCSCGGIIKPDVVLYGEGLDQDIMLEAVDYISNADVLIVGGTSLAVYPAAGFVNYYSGNKLVLINKSDIKYSRKIDLFIQGSIGEVLAAL